MKFSASHIWIISALAATALIGLVAIQLNWLRGVFHEREEKLTDRMEELLEVINQYYEEEMEGRYNIDAMMIAQNANERQRFLSHFDQMFKEVLRNEGLNANFEYGLISCRSDRFKWYTDINLEENIMAGHTVRLGGCGKLQSSSSGEHLHFYSILPRKSFFIFKQLGLAIGSSILFILMLIGAFAYTLVTIRRQKKLSEMKSAFINNLTHEFKTPIATISLAARTLNRMGPGADFQKTKAYASLIDQESKRLENQVDKILQMAVIDAGNFSLDLKTIDAHQSIEQVLQSLQLIIEKKEAVVDLHLEATDAWIKADELHFFNILYNIVDNAIKYSPEAPYIRIRTVNTPALRIDIDDNGIGMSKEVQRQIFSAFYRSETGDSHDVKGFGLGLSYVQKMVEAHEGEVRVNSQAGVGTQFQLTFPTIPVPETPTYA
ncbi:MAG: HAMP domain-containing histidine kinase [Saprospiraceae bacterium]|nr:HAMP domain-containing histidine kinase [Saprospiraceae bacterium]